MNNWEPKNGNAFLVPKIKKEKLMKDQMSQLNEFKQFLMDRQKSPTTIIGYVGDIVSFSKWFAQTYTSDFSVEDLDTELARIYKKALSDGGIHPRTINRRLASLRAFAAWAQQTDYLPQGPNPISNVRPARQVMLAPKWIDHKERSRLLRTVDAEVKRAMILFPRLRFQIIRDAAILKMFLHTGLRVDELANLQLTDINMDDRRGVLVVRNGKGAKRREIPLNPDARSAIQTYLKIRPDDAGLTNLFVDMKATKIEKRTIQRAVARFAKLAGLQHVSCHTLRHTFAKDLIDRGVTLEKVAALLGHSNLNTTRIYTTPSSRDLEAAVNLLIDDKP
ncbi:MAG TPA: tyrosine-type recombinase/integrase [Anaerolineaceae bacterium]|nr:tyrosine-type recombinase/integrase [Anaerolineaceae bacterium]HPN52865.1 tyrosine-type recombinase/integrase [Anaerolineaceae bacterium]